MYSISVDIQGYLVEKLSGKSFADFVRERIFEPLGMKDTGFYVPRKNSVALRRFIKAAPVRALGHAARSGDISSLPGCRPAAVDLYSTARDYLRFTQMVLNGGELNGVRLVAPSSIELMRTNHVPDAVKNANKFGIGYYHMQPGLGFGYDFAILEDPLKLGSTAGEGYVSLGRHCRHLVLDRSDQRCDFRRHDSALAMAPGAPDVENLSRALTYQALVDPEKVMPRLARIIMKKMTKHSRDRGRNCYSSGTCAAAGASERAGLF